MAIFVINTEKPEKQMPIVIENHSQQKKTRVLITVKINFFWFIGTEGDNWVIYCLFFPFFALSFVLFIFLSVCHSFLCERSVEKVRHSFKFVSLTERSWHPTRVDTFCGYKKTQKMRKNWETITLDDEDLFYRNLCV